MVKRALVTGGAGFIGAHLVRALAAHGTPVRVLDNLVAGSPANLSRALGLPDADVASALGTASGGAVSLTATCEVVIGDIRDAHTVATACAGVDIVFHQAALRSVPRSVADPWTTHDVNVTGTLRVLEAARAAGVRRVVFASSSSVYGDAHIPSREDQIPRPKSPYAASKLAAEAYCSVYARVFGLSTVSLRYFNVFGPWQDPASEYAAVIPKFILLAMRGEPVPVHGDGLQSRDFTFVDNVVEANMAAAETAAHEAVLNIGAGQRYTLIDLIDAIERIRGQRVGRIHEGPRAGDIRHTEADISLARRTIGYEPRIDFKAGLRLTIDAMRDAATVDSRS